MADIDAIKPSWYRRPVTWMCAAALTVGSIGGWFGKDAMGPDFDELPAPAAVRIPDGEAKTAKDVAKHCDRYIKAAMVGPFECVEHDGCSDELNQLLTGVANECAKVNGVNGKSKRGMDGVLRFDEPEKAPTE